MDRKKLVNFGLITLGILTANSVKVLAQTNFERYPTAAELQTLREKSRAQIRSGEMGNIGSSVDDKERTAFVREWSRVYPGIASFLGEWSGSEEAYAVYPSNTRGRVCLIYIAPTDIDFSVANLVNGQLRSDDKNVMLQEGNFLTFAYVTDNKPDIYMPPFSYASVPQPVREFAQKSAASAGEIDQVIRQFNAAGCTASLPSRNRR